MASVHQPCRAEWRAVCSDGGKLFVSDSHHERILVWNTIPSRSGAPADLVLGQPALTTCSGDGGAPSARTLHRSGDLWSEGTRLVVADQQNHRVLVWNAPGEESLGASASVNVKVRSRFAVPAPPSHRVR